ncbi:hypothetical protein BYZ73_19255 [Rhodovulum viride]|uniref:Toprim domain-containing protein n=1 Tax=Rhodovulum viride TaxID=1231134 RepID=A0ABX9DCX8_9RHOB|nr:hypothetical protein [Rhodovulum viride]RAP39659.1 hypothetical protein BYZ73_19255 [Rhodovulum viride]
MIGLIETYANGKGWNVGTANVLVEGASDVRYLRLARDLWQRESNHDLFDSGFAVFEAGLKDDGGVQGVVRELQTLRQMASQDVVSLMPERKFVGLFDNDRAGRKHAEMLCEMDFRVKHYRDVFVLHPIMPTSNGVLGPELQRRAEAKNGSCAGLDWEIEDYLPEDLIQGFCNSNPGTLKHEQRMAGRVHREFTREGKGRLPSYVAAEALVEDMIELIRLICALRSYFGLEHETMCP